MTILRSGASKDYSEKWESAFGKKKTKSKAKKASPKKKSRSGKAKSKK